MEDAAPALSEGLHPAKDIAFGSIAGSLSKVFEHPFDLCKVRLQSQPPDQALRFTGPLDCFQQTWRKEGLRGLYRGLSAPIFGAAVENASLFFIYNRIQEAILAARGAGANLDKAEVTVGELALSAAGAGAVSSFLLTPIELVKVKMQVTLLTREGLMSTPVSTGGATALSTGQGPRPNFATLPGPLAIIRQTVASHGFRGLWLGQSGTLLRETGGSSAWFTAFEMVSRAFMRLRERERGLATGELGKADLKAWELCVAGAAAGMSYNIVLFPADTIKSAMQTRAELRPDQKHGLSFAGTAKEIYAARGLRGLYAGCGITVARAAPSSALIFLLYEKMVAHFG